jgi:predicted XRE-type DNA-binding protein
MKRNSLIEASSGNVFADLGDKQAPETLLKSRLAQRLTNVIKTKGLTPSEVAAVLGIDQPKVSKILRGRLREFSTDRLFRFLNALDQDIQIVITEKPASRRQARLTVAQSNKHLTRK